MEGMVWRRTLACAGAGLATLAIAACGSSSSSSSSASGSSGGSTSASSGGSSTSGGSSGGSGAAAAAVAKAKMAPTGIGITTPLKKKPETGKTVAFLRCSQPVCSGFALGLVPAAKALGWTIRNIPFQPTPESANNALTTAAKLKPYGIYMSGVPSSVLGGGLAAAKANGVPVIDAYDLNPVSGALVANIADGPHGNVAAPAATSAWIANDSKCKGTLGVVNIPTYPILTFDAARLEADLKKYCPDMKTTRINAQATDVGTKLPAQIVGAVQKNPDIKYVAFGFGDEQLGVYAALKGAGVSAKLVGYGAGEPTNVQAIAKGQQDAETVYGIPYNGYRAIDAIARYHQKMSLKDSTTAPNPAQLFDSSNSKGLTSWTQMGVAKDMPQQFYKLWHVSGG